MKKTLKMKSYKTIKMDKKLLNEDIQNMKYLFGYKPGRVISEQKQFDNTGYWTQNTTMDMDKPIPLRGSDEYDYTIGKEINDSILKKHNLFDDVNYFNYEIIILENKSSKIIKRFISILPLLKDFRLLFIRDCEYADFSEINICDLPYLEAINLRGTENNILEFDCVREIADNLYSLG